VETESEVRSLNQQLIRSVLLLTLSRLIVNMTRRFAYPFAPAIARELEVPVASVQTVIGLQSGAQVSSPIFGPLSERYGRKRVMIGALLLMALVAGVAALLPTFAIFAVVLILFGIGKTIFDPAMQAYVGDRIPYRRRAAALGVTELSWAGSLLTVAPLAGFILESSTLAALMAVFCVLFALAALFMWAALPPDHPARGSVAMPISPIAAFGILRRSPAALASLFYAVAIGTANDIFFINYGTFMEQSFELALEALGLVTIVIAAAEVLGELTVIGLSDRLGNKRVALFGAFGACLIYLVLPVLSTSLALALIGIFIMFYFVEMSIVSSIPLFTEVLPEARSIMMAGVSSAASLGRLLGAALGGLLFALTQSFAVMGVIAAVIGLLGALAMLRYIRLEE
jgi:MFS transporter, DHA1 family, inner membrane transport protein